MFSKTLFFVLTFFTLLVAATTTTITEHPPNPSPTNSADCSQVGFNPVCCTTVFNEAAAPLPSIILGLIAIVIDAGTQLFGLGCVPIIGGICNANVVCCETSAVGGLINIGCVNIIV